MNSRPINVLALSPSIRPPCSVPLEEIATVFTGLVQATGILQPQGEYEVLISYQERGAKIATGLELGDSVSVDGVCLTVSRILETGFVAAVSPETLRRTTLGYRAGDRPVNLESSLRVGSKLGGHFVTGHVDGIGVLEAATATATSWELRFHIQGDRAARYIVPKGSIAINGISLTVAECDATGHAFTVAVIPVTYAETNLRTLQPGDPVNLEGDLLGKYVEKFLRLSPHEPAMENGAIAPVPPDLSINAEFLTEHGYL